MCVCAHVCVFVGRCLATKTRGNIQQMSYIPQTEQHEPFGRLLFRLGNVTIMCMCVWEVSNVPWVQLCVQPQRMGHQQVWHNGCLPMYHVEGSMLRGED